MERNSFMPNSSFPMSRDYGITLWCANNKCYLNAHGQCVSPSSVAINKNGVCELYATFKEATDEAL